MLKKGLKYIITAAVVLLVGYNSVYFKKLDEVKAASTASKFDAVAFSRDYLDKKLPASLGKAVEIQQLLGLIQSAPEKTFESYSHALGIGNVRYFLVKGRGEISSINENDMTLVIRSDSGNTVVKLATEFVFGNAVRDASGLININEFENTMDFNNVSAEINKSIRNNVLPPFKAAAKKGNVVDFVGAIELNRENIVLENIEVIPVSLKIVH
jgi:predicted lipoprotein